MSGSLINDKYKLSVNFCILQAHQSDIIDIRLDILNKNI